MRIKRNGLKILFIIITLMVFSSCGKNSESKGNEEAIIEDNAADSEDMLDSEQMFQDNATEQVVEETSNDVELIEEESETEDESEEVDVYTLMYYAMFDGMDYLRAGEDDKALEQFEIAADLGSEDGIYMVGYMNDWRSPLCEGKDYSKALECYEEVGNYIQLANISRGMMYKYGRGVEKDEVYAKSTIVLTITTLSEPQNWTEWEQYTGGILLGDVYANGDETKPNFEKAKSYYELAAEAGNPYGYYCIGMMYQNGITVVRDDNLAAEWFDKAKEAGYGN